MLYNHTKSTYSKCIEVINMSVYFCLPILEMHNSIAIVSHIVLDLDAWFIVGGGPSLQSVFKPRLS